MGIPIFSMGAAVCSVTPFPNKLLPTHPNDFEVFEANLSTQLISPTEYRGFSCFAFALITPNLIGHIIAQKICLAGKLRTLMPCPKITQ